MLTCLHYSISTLPNIHKMKSFIALLAILLAGADLFSQSVAINDNNSTAASCAMLDINTYGTAKKGLLIPRLATSERNSITSPVNGLLVYDLTLNSFMVFSNGNWVQVIQSNNNTWTNNGTYTYNTYSQPVCVTNSSLSSEAMLNVIKSTDASNGIEPLLTLTRGSNVTPTNGIGNAIIFRNQVNNGSVSLASRISAITEDATVASNKHALQIDAYSQGFAYPQFYLNKDGVSIGSNALPQSKLHVFADGSLLGGIRVSAKNTQTVAAAIMLEGATNSWVIEATNNGSGTGSNKMVFRNYTDALNCMVIDSSGNIGIGTDVPGAGNKLNVNGNINFTGTLKANGNSGTSGDVLVSNGTSTPQWKTVMYGCRETLTNLLTLATGVSTQLAGFTEQYDDGGGFNPATGEYTIPADGVYSFTCNVYFAASPATTNAPVTIRFLKNGNVFIGDQLSGYLTSTVTYTSSFNFTIVNKFAAGDIITLTVLQESGASHGIIGGTSTSASNLTIFKVY